MSVLRFGVLAGAVVVAAGVVPTLPAGAASVQASVSDVRSSGVRSAQRAVVVELTDTHGQRSSAAVEGLPGHAPRRDRGVLPTPDGPADAPGTAAVLSGPIETGTFRVAGLTWDADAELAPGHRDPPEGPRERGVVGLAGHPRRAGRGQPRPPRHRTLRHRGCRRGAGPHLRQPSRPTQRSRPRCHPRGRRAEPGWWLDVECGAGGVRPTRGGTPGGRRLGGDDPTAAARDREPGRVGCRRVAAQGLGSHGRSAACRGGPPHRRHQLLHPSPIGPDRAGHLLLPRGHERVG